MFNFLRLIAVHSIFIIALSIDCYWYRFNTSSAIENRRFSSHLRVYSRLCRSSTAIIVRTAFALFILSQNSHCLCMQCAMQCRKPLKGRRKETMWKYHEGRLRDVIRASTTAPITGTTIAVVYMRLSNCVCAFSSCNF